MTIEKRPNELLVTDPTTSVGEIKMALEGERPIVNFEGAGEITRSAVRGTVPLPDYKVGWIQAELPKAGTDPAGIPKIAPAELEERLENNEAVPQFYKSLTQPSNELDRGDIVRAWRGVELPSGEQVGGGGVPDPGGLDRKTLAAIGAFALLALVGWS